MNFGETIDYLVSNSTNSPKLVNNNYNHSDTIKNNSKCAPVSIYIEPERFYYLFVMCPIAFIGIFLNLISLKVFNHKTFNSVTFKYLRLITITDLFICLIIIPYCLTSYTQPFNKYDLYARHFYLAYVYLPGANIAINLSMLLNLLVTIERLITVGWPTRRHSLFKPSRYYLSCVIVFGFSVLFNIANFFLYKIELCENNLKPRLFTGKKWWSIYGYIKEVLTRVLPIIILIIANIVLIYIVRTSRKKMRKNKSMSLDSQSSTKLSCKKSSKPSFFNSFKQKKSTTEILEMNSVLIRNQNAKRNRQDNQLTWMTIFVAILYSASSIPMVFAYPGLIFSGEETNKPRYKIYAAWVNILELIQCSFRFMIYFCFTTQFRLILYQMLGHKTKKHTNEPTIFNKEEI